MFQFNIKNKKKTNFLNNAYVIAFELFSWRVTTEQCGVNYSLPRAHYSVRNLEHVHSKLNSYFRNKPTRLFFLKILS